MAAKKLEQRRRGEGFADGTLVPVIERHGQPRDSAIFLEGGAPHVWVEQGVRLLSHSSAWSWRMADPPSRRQTALHRGSAVTQGLTAASAGKLHLKIIAMARRIPQTNPAAAACLRPAVVPRPLRLTWNLRHASDTMKVVPGQGIDQLAAARWATSVSSASHAAAWGDTSLSCHTCGQPMMALTARSSTAGTAPGQFSRRPRQTSSASCEAKRRLHRLLAAAASSADAVGTAATLIAADSTGIPR